MAATTFKPQRIASIDIFRALTMVCMIFVNDFGSLINVPHWLQHAANGEDFLGFSDVVFPAFLFAVGLSIPFAIENRIAKGDSHLKIISHILLRSFSLLVMGVFTVNYGAGVSATTGISQPVFALLMVAGFLLVWNVYPKSDDWKKYLFIALQILGVALLVYLAVIFRDKTGGIMQKRWWGILGLIGWTYLLCALVYVVVRKRLYVMLLVLLAFILLSMAGSNRWLGLFSGYIISNGAFHGFTISGIIVSLLCNRYASVGNVRKLFVILVGAALFMLLAGFVARNWWIISKLSETPTWVFLCTGISILLYVFLYWLTDMNGKKHWFAIIKPAGTATLTCYLLPYIAYSLIQIFGVKFPDAIRMYPAGLLKSLIFALLLVGMTELLGKVHIKLKI